MSRQFDPQTSFSSRSSFFSKYNPSKELEFVTMHELSVDDIVESADSCSLRFYFISTHWLKAWAHYAKGFTKQPPGCIRNAELLDAHGTVPRLRPDLHHGKDMRVVSEVVWNYLLNIHGGGPQICCKELNIYSQFVEIDMLRRTGDDPRMGSQTSTASFSSHGSSSYEALGAAPPSRWGSGDSTRLPTPSERESPASSVAAKARAFKCALFGKLCREASREEMDVQRQEALSKWCGITDVVQDEPWLNTKIDSSDRLPCGETRDTSTLGIASDTCTNGGRPAELKRKKTIVI